MERLSNGHIQVLLSQSPMHRFLSYNIWRLQQLISKKFATLAFAAIGIFATFCFATYPHFSGFLATLVFNRNCWKNTLLQHFAIVAMTAKVILKLRKLKIAKTGGWSGGYYCNTTRTRGKSADNLFSNLNFNLSNSNTNYTKTI